MTNTKPNYTSFIIATTAIVLIALAAVYYFGMHITDVTFDGGKVNVLHTNGVVKIYDGATGGVLRRTWRPCIPFREKSKIDGVIFSKGEVSVWYKHGQVNEFQGNTGRYIGGGTGFIVDEEFMKAISTEK